MKNQPARQADPILIIVLFIGIFFLIMGSFNGGMLGVFMSSIAIIINLFSIFYAVMKLRKQIICPSCGVKARSVKDNFCRHCGAPYEK